MSDILKIRNTLAVKLYETEARLREIEIMLRQPIDDDSEEAATELEGEWALEHLRDIAAEEARRLRSALAQLDDGTYGLCEGCGRSIARRRLKAVPHATTCLRCSEVAA